MTDLYYLTTETVKRFPETYCRERFPLRFERSGRYRFEEDRLRCLGAGILLSEVLGAEEKELTTGQQGKLYLPAGGKHFNLSHSGAYIVLAVSENEVGVDVEEEDSRHLEVAGRVYQPEELEWMEEDPVKRFFRLWTMKESVMKMLGMGLSLDPRSFSVLPAVMDRGPVSVCQRTVFPVNLELPGYALAVCSEHAAAIGKVLELSETVL